MTEICGNQFFDFSVKPPFDENYFCYGLKYFSLQKSKIFFLIHSPPIMLTSKSDVTSELLINFRTPFKLQHNAFTSNASIQHFSIESFLRARLLATISQRFYGLFFPLSPSLVRAAAQHRRYRGFIRVRPCTLKSRGYERESTNRERGRGGGVWCRNGLCPPIYILPGGFIRDADARFRRKQCASNDSLPRKREGKKIVVEQSPATPFALFLRGTRALPPRFNVPRWWYRDLTRGSEEFESI